MLATVTLNPSLDKTIYVDALGLDDTNRAQGYRLDPGGKGLNVSRVLWELGQASLLFGFLGGDTGRKVEKFLVDEGLVCDFNWTVGETRENLIIQQAGQRLQTKISMPGPTIRVDELHRLKRKIAGRTKDYGWIVFSGSIPPGLDKGVYRELAEEATLRQDRVVLDADGEALRLGLEARPFMIKPNLHELQRMVGHALPTPEAVHGALDEILDGGRVELVILSNGPAEVIAATRRERWLAVPPKVEVRSTVGAGDSMVAGFLHRFTQGAGLEESLRWAVAAGTACVAAHGTELAHYADVLRFAPEVTLTPCRGKAGS
ncbi:MAG: 1-phosphofructokinase [Candidatus Sericytochromatia bacterium]|nr:1-phosphofructokinase [Candidatus Sericytochromatia bacterium]